MYSPVTSWLPVVTPATVPMRRRAATVRSNERTGTRSVIDPRGSFPSAVVSLADTNPPTPVASDVTLATASSNVPCFTTRSADPVRTILGCTEVSWASGALPEPALAASAAVVLRPEAVEPSASSRMAIVVEAITGPASAVGGAALSAAASEVEPPLAAVVDVASSAWLPMPHASARRAITATPATSARARRLRRAGRRRRCLAVDRSAGSGVGVARMATSSGGGLPRCPTPTRGAPIWFPAIPRQSVQATGRGAAPLLAWGLRGCAPHHR